MSSTFIGPPPKFNRMDVKGLFSKEWLETNPVSAITALATMILSILTTCLALRVYNELIREISEEERRRESYEQRTSLFVQKQQLLDRPDVSWFHKLLIKMRSDWPLGALVAGYTGDPFLKSQRLLVFWAAILIGMVLNVPVLARVLILSLAAPSFDLCIGWLRMTDHNHDYDTHDDR
jgi:hypothetical protein